MLPAVLHVAVTFRTIEGAGTTTAQRGEVVPAPLVQVAAKAHGVQAPVQPVPAPATGVAGAGTGCTGACTPWALAATCTNGAGTTSPRWAVVVPAPSIVRNVTATCNTAGSINGASPYTVTNGDGTGYVY